MFLVWINIVPPSHPQKCLPAFYPCPFTVYSQYNRQGDHFKTCIVSLICSNSWGGSPNHWVEAKSLLCSQRRNSIWTSYPTSFIFLLLLFLLFTLVPSAPAKLALLLSNTVDTLHLRALVLAIPSARKRVNPEFLTNSFTYLMFLIKVSLFKEVYLDYPF